MVFVYWATNLRWDSCWSCYFSAPFDSAQGAGSRVFSVWWM